MKGKSIEHPQMIAAIVTWFAVTALYLWLSFKYPENLADGRWLALLLSTINLGAFWLGTAGNPSRRVSMAANIVQLGSALGVGWVMPVSFSPIYTIIWAAALPRLYSLRVCWMLLAAAMTAWWFVMTNSWGDDNALFSVVLWSTFHLFALLTSRVARRAEEARDEVEALNRELMATQHLLSEASRQGERTRIARNLHDLLGHHLTALTINLQIAERMTDGDAKAKVAESRALARLLLSDVREAVDTLRNEGGVDVAHAIELLAEHAPELDVAVDIQGELQVDNVEIAQALTRCAQEAITNTLRHANATRCWIQIWQEDGKICLDIRDDGNAPQALTPGNGLTGMRERFEALRGSLSIDTVDNALHLHAQIPLVL